nr:hypothetical protein [Tanacetum cinerariifolium]
MQTQTSNTLHNAIMEAGGKDRLPMLAHGNYIQWKSRIKRYIDTKPNHELIHYCLKNPPYKYTWADKTVLVSEGSSKTTTETYMENYKNVSQDLRDQLNDESEVVQIILIGIDNDIYSIVDGCPNACEMWKAIKRLKQGESINVQDLETNLYWEFGKFTSRDVLTSTTTRMQRQNKVNELRAERLARTANPLALVAQQQPVYHPQNHPTNYNQNSSTRSQQAAIRNRGKAIVNSPLPIYDQEPSMVAEDDEIGTGYENQRIGNVVRARENVGTPVLQKSKIQCYNYKEYGHVARECQKPKRVPNNDHYNVFTIESEHPEQSKSIHDTYSIEQDEHNVIIDSLDMSYDREQIDQNDDDDDDALANKFDKLKAEIKDFKTKNKSLESSKNHFKEANNELSKTNELMYNDLKKFQAELDRRKDVKYASKVEIDCAKAKWDLISYKMESQKSFNKYTQTINDLNQTISKIKKEMSAHQETISTLSQAKEAQIKLYKTCENKELDKVIALENKVKVLDNIVYKTGQSFQTMNMLNSKCKMSFPKHEFLKKAQRANPRLYDIGCYNDNLALMLAAESDEVIRLERESRSKLSDLIRPFDYEKLNNLYDLFVPQREKSSTQRYFSERSKMSHTPVNNGNSKESFNKQTTLLEKRMDESIPYDQKCKSSKELFKIKRSVATIFDGMELCKQTIAKRTHFGVIPPTSVSRPKLKSNQIKDRVMINNSQGKKQEIEDHRKNVKFSKNKTSVTACNDSLNAKISNVNFVCATCGKYVLNAKHDMDDEFIRQDIRTLFYGRFAFYDPNEKENQKKDKIGSKQDKNGKRVEAGKSLKQLQWIKEEKPKKTQKEWSKTHAR